MSSEHAIEQVPLAEIRLGCPRQRAFLTAEGYAKRGSGLPHHLNYCYPSPRPHNLRRSGSMIELSSAFDHLPLLVGES